MDEGIPRRGGLSVWAPSAVPPIGAELTDEQALASAFRVLAREGFVENLAGHITWQRDGRDHMLVNPWGLWWREVKSSDICTVDSEARVVSGKWDVTPAIHIHTELHRLRPDARVVVHNHPYYASVLAALGVLPELVHQTGSLLFGDMTFVSEYIGEIDDPLLGTELARQIGDAPIAVLANHGVVVTGSTIAEACYRSVTLERMCHLSYDVMVSGRDPLLIAPGVMKGMKASLLERAADVYWAGAVRWLLREEPDVLD